ncbi:MAG: TerB family tellurite resistance protein [Pseudomonadota bacterium]
MHILIGLITAIATLLFALDRLGVDIGWLNPWAWQRRRRWVKQLSVNPAFNLESPLEAVALLLVATAKIDGDLSSEEKAELRKLLEGELKQTPENASALLRSSTYLLADGEAVIERPDQVLERSLQKFTADQKSSTLEMLGRISQVGSERSEAQRVFISKIAAVFEPERRSGDW